MTPEGRVRTEGPPRLVIGRLGVDRFDRFPSDDRVLDPFDCDLEVAFPVLDRAELDPPNRSEGRRSDVVVARDVPVRDGTLVRSIRPEVGVDRVVVVRGVDSRVPFERVAVDRAVVERVALVDVVRAPAVEPLRRTAEVDVRLAVVLDEAVVLSAVVRRPELA